jgi:site-specific DNA-methyltransferase (adenine-specific)
MMELADCQLHCGDCLDILPTIPDASVDMVLCDLPYGTTACKWDSVIPFEPLWREYRRVTKPNAAIVLTASQPFTTALIASNLKEFRYCWVWQKDKPSNFAQANRQPLKYHEDVAVFYQAQPTYNKQMEPRTGSGAARCGYIVDNSRQTSDHISLREAPKMFNPDEKNPSSVQRFSTGRRQDITHPTAKPVALMEYLIRTYTNEGDTVLDNCMGSGTTGVACVNMGRKFIGIEREPSYFAIAQERILNQPLRLAV